VARQMGSVIWDFSYNDLGVSRVDQAGYTLAEVLARHAAMPEPVMA